MCLPVSSGPRGAITAAYACYEEAMRNDVEQNLNLGQKMAREMSPQSRWQIWVRTQMIRALPYLPWKGLVTKQILEPLKRAANAITLKDYQADTHGSGASTAGLPLAERESYV
jgi:2-polyprenyl-6-methoxyphenol hydroxylase-like FAD-dependent oxidoreductase